MTRNRLLEYLGLRRAPGTERTAADRVWSVTMIAVITVTGFLTRDLGSWSQLAAMVGVAAVAGVLGGVTVTTLARRRRPRA